MQIRFISGLTAEEENQFAPSLLRAITTILDQFSLAYTLRIETSGNQVYQHSQPAQPLKLASGDGQTEASGPVPTPAPLRLRMPPNWQSRRDG
jgi:hypothetical protein